MPANAPATALLEALFTHAPVGLAFWDRDLRYVRINATLASINGIAPDDHLGRTPSELLGALGVEAEQTMRAVLEDGLPRVEVDIAGATPALPGELRHWKVSWYAIPGEDRRPIGVAAVVVETTGERRLRREQQETTALLDAVFGAAPVGIAFWDLDLRYRRVNEALATINGVPAADHLGRRPSEVLGGLGGTVERLMGEVVAHGRPVVDHELEATLPDGRRQFRHTTLFPVRDVHGDLAGLAGVVRDVTAQHESEAERTRLLREALVSRAAAEAAQVRAEAAKAEAEAARRRTDFLARAGERLAVLTRDYERTLQEVAWLAVPEMADFCLVALLGERGTPQTVAVAAADPDQDRLAIELGEHFVADLDARTGTGAALRTGEPQFIPQITDAMITNATADPEARRLLRALHLSNALVVPLRARNRTIGALTLVYAESGRHYEEDDLRLARSLAVRAALAVENARLYTERSHIAQTLQRSLLPPALPDIPGLELAARYRAAGDQNDVGGDFYDVYRAHDDGDWTVLIGDVSGKGAEAAALTSLTRHTLRAASLRTRDPVQSLELLNEALWAQADPVGRFCTVMYAQVRPDAHGAQIRLATGGHLPPMVLRAGGRVERVQVRGAIVGGLRDPTFGDRTFRLDHDDLLLLFTDGVVELRRRGADGIDIGDRALEEVLSGMRGASAEDIVSAVERSAVELQGGEPRDDIALLAIRPRVEGP
jgi:PAS domain S-box-containing protein